MLCQNTCTFAALADPSIIHALVADRATVWQAAYDGEGVPLRPHRHHRPPRLRGHVLEVALGKLIAFRKGGVLRYVGTDHLGSTVRVTSSSFAAEDQQRYRPFGASRDAGTSLNTDHGFTGQVEDASIGLYWYATRAYDASLGRFVCPDSIVPSPGDPQSLNRYSYVRNNPLGRVDPTGQVDLDLASVIADLNERGLVDRFGRPTDANAAERMGDIQWWQDNSPAFRGGLYEVMTDEALARGIDRDTLEAVFRYERGARELSLPGGREAEALIGFFRTETSIGPAQMQVRTAEALEDTGYMPERDRWGTVLALLDDAGAVRYAAAYLQSLQDQLRTSSDAKGTAYSDLVVDEQRRILAIGYNAGWDGPDGLQKKLERLEYSDVIKNFYYDDQVFDGYPR